MFDRILTMAIALSLALLLWLFARSRHWETIDARPPAYVQREDSLSDCRIVDLEVPVQFLCPPAFAYQARFATCDGESKVKIRARVPAELENLSIAAYIDLTRKVYDKGQHVGRIHFRFPPGVKIMDEDVEPALFELAPLDMPTRNEVIPAKGP